ncbi:transcriptional regulator, RpiR family [Aromatoleum tolulyticum]|uniref:Glucokinase n=1 Tax=Aromatoleum tolulyticum TaxID=34027 RepID=A0A1N6Q5G1_9RHOO|nr:glucokinase [Aromatoleum tolulyticum]SIQ11790.1 transcriptional regulator, RpiR family [Aromatoleum tolulyticum]
MTIEEEKDLNRESAPEFGDGPRLLADIGATNARFALERAPGRVEAIEVLHCGDYAGIVDVIQAYLRQQGGPAPRHAAIAIANPIDGDHVKMTNRDWQFSIEETRRALGFDTLLVVNDFTALAMALSRLSTGERVQVGGGEPAPDGVIGLIGPGTGLGVSGLIPAEDRWITLGSEGGHTTFAPADERELFILQYAWREMPHVSSERFVSGPGLELIHRALAERNGVAGVQPLNAADIVTRAVAGGDPLCAEVIDCFCAMLGTVASDLALTLGSVGGIYIGGGVVPRLGALFQRSSFRQRFEAKGRFADYLARIPTYLITAPYPALQGVSAILGHHLQAGTGGSPLIEKVRAALPNLSKAEQRVARLLLEQPRSFVNDPVADIAHHADVSQPTVIRFCRTMGFTGLSDFRLKLASGLTGTVPVRHSQVKAGDAAPDLSAKVLDNTVSAILSLRDGLDPAAVELAIGLLQKASRIEFYGAGNSSIVALDGQYKFFRFRIPAVAYADPRLEAMAAELLGPGDVVVAISSSGRLPELLHAVDLALAAGAAVISITASHSPLAKKATVNLAVDHSEDISTHVSMISRILHLLMLDVLAVGVAVRGGVRRAGLPGSRRSSDAGDVGALVSHAS